MNSTNTKNKKRSLYAIILACLLNTMLLLMVFFLELHQPLPFNYQKAILDTLLVKLIEEQEPSKKISSPENEAGLMIRGATDGTLPPSIISDYIQSKSHLEHAQPPSSSDFEPSEADLNPTSKPAEPMDNNNLPTQEEQGMPNPQQADLDCQSISCSNKERLDDSPSLFQRKNSFTPSPMEIKTDKKRSLSPTKSLAQMTQAAFNSACSQGNAAIFSAGDKHKLPSELQLAEEQYWIKVEQAFRNHSASYSHTLPHPGNYKQPLASVIIKYLPNGIINETVLHSSSGSTTIDQIILSIFNDIRLLIPALPNRLLEIYGSQRSCIIYY